MIARLRKIVLCETGGQVDYLLPLVQKGQGRAFTIATLNYDNTIELACESVQVPFTVGLDQWAEYGEFRKPEQGIELLKLHGSIDWDWVPDPRTGQEMPISSRTVQRVPLEE